ncbi:MAG: hypothetical protein MRY74_06470 [Neomegalonema sp.]|nr:hypothetical protein [Neomegalonema sp.]
MKFYGLSGVVAILIALAAPAAAQEYRKPLDASTLRTAVVETIRACAAEARGRCGGYPGGPLACLLDAPVLSTKCASSLEKIAPVAEGFVVCAPDIDRFCHGVPPKRGRIATCIAEHWDVVSAPCYSALKAGAEAYRATY